MGRPIALIAIRVTDGGHHPSEYFDKVLRTMLHPRTGQLLEWEWVLDYYHACLYITKIAEVLFGKQTQQAASWAAKMRRWLKDKKGGILRVLHSAAAHAWALGVRAAEEKTRYEEAFGYLQNRKGLMDYWSCRRRGLAIGSGITEAACKTLFTQRFKQSGMKMVARVADRWWWWICVWDLDQQAVASGLCRLCEPVIPGRQAN